MREELLSFNSSKTFSWTLPTVPAVLNAKVLDSALQPFRRKSQGGHPHVIKKIWELAIPQYDGGLETDRRLAALGLECAGTVQNILAGLPDKRKQGSIGRLRALIREKLKDQLSDVDTIVKGIL